MLNGGSDAHLCEMPVRQVAMLNPICSSLRTAALWILYIYLLYMIWLIIGMPTNRNLRVEALGIVCVCMYICHVADILIPVNRNLRVEALVDL